MNTSMKGQIKKTLQVLKLYKPVRTVRENIYYFKRQYRSRHYFNPKWIPNDDGYKLGNIEKGKIPSSNKLDANTWNYLRRRNPYLLELQREYSKLNLFDESFWMKFRKRIDLVNFRGQDYYLSQLEYSASLIQYIYTCAFIEKIDEDNLLFELGEDDLFGAITFQLLEDLVVSRDLLESILEIQYLRRKLNLIRTERYISLDIGAGYGRFAHRFTTAFPKSYIHCVDGVAESTFLCDFYIGFRKFKDRAESVPLNELDRLSRKKIDFACNIHSWSECTLSAVRYWMDFLTDLRVKYLFVVPHQPQFLTMEKDGSSISYLPEIERHGYKLIANENNYGDSRIGSLWGIYNAQYAIFELK